MNNLIECINNISSKHCDLPFSIYSSVHQQRLLNVPIAKPLLVAVLNGEKRLGGGVEGGESAGDDCVSCTAGNFVFLSNTPSIHVRNIPNKNRGDNAYFALLIEFDSDDFKHLPISIATKADYCMGKLEPALLQCLQQFVECARWAPKALWSMRKREILELLCLMGYENILAMLNRANVAEQLSYVFRKSNFSDVPMQEICNKLAMSESTLRRKLKAEGTSVQAVKDAARLGLGLHLLQTTIDSIGVIADKCGYQSQSRFSDRFKGRFGVTPSEFKKTKILTHNQ